MVNKKDQDTSRLILDAARTVFREQGMSGARMRQIAEQAGINPALLHYYFRSKEQLFKAVFMEDFNRLVPQINSIFEQRVPLFEKIRTFVADYIDFLIANPHLPAFIINELNQNPAFATEMQQSRNHPNPEFFFRQIQSEVASGNIREIAPFQLVSNIMSLCVFPFIAKPMVKMISGMSEEQIRAFYLERKKSVADFVIHSIQLQPEK